MKVMKFGASWCKPCSSLSKTLDSMDIRIPIEHIDIDSQASLAKIWGVRSVPTMILIDNTHEVRRIMGAQPKEAITEFLGVHA